MSEEVYEMLVAEVPDGKVALFYSLDNISLTFNRMRWNAVT